MAKRGHCRCGTILTFELTSQGYKTRCPVCQSVVRLRVDPPHNRRDPRRSSGTIPMPALAVVAPPALPPDHPAPAPADVRESNGPPDFSVLDVNETTAPTAMTEMEVFRDEPAREPPAKRRNWRMLAALLAAVVVAGGAAALLLGSGVL